MSNIITKAHPVLDMHSTGLRVVGAWLFAIVLILFSIRGEKRSVSICGQPEKA